MCDGYFGCDSAFIGLFVCLGTVLFGLFLVVTCVWFCSVSFNVDCLNVVFDLFGVILCCCCVLVGTWWLECFGLVCYGYLLWLFCLFGFDWLCAWLVVSVCLFVICLVGLLSVRLCWVSGVCWWLFVLLLNNSVAGIAFVLLCFIIILWLDVYLCLLALLFRWMVGFGLFGLVVIALLVCLFW